MFLFPNLFSQPCNRVTVIINYYPHMPIGKVWIYRLLLVFCFFVCLFFVCTVTDFSGEDNASGVKFCTVV